MPPWKPTAAAFAFHNDRRLSDDEIKTLAAWVDGGTPEGDKKDAPPPLKFTDGWMLGKPDLILTSGDEFHLGASGPDTFRCYVLPTNLPEDKYIIGFEVKPGNPRIVHHTLNYWDLTGKARKLELQAKEQRLRGRPRPRARILGRDGSRVPAGHVPTRGSPADW